MYGSELSELSELCELELFIINEGSSEPLLPVDPSMAKGRSDVSSSSDII